eukprot:CAMPEP_0183740354 /NCGR_PEP_ID=MMETSP0737-20130205/59429_1 /TAXON_ID=385413 /ORGANISM="Thalassiosira miniscula, Strain CCMP1093" /LENGTH=154 /DNA_ID=CAMNT_0025975397 /DNA_START=243 /DNA_END=703 /DNA_ORIENTATION=-
MGNASTEIQRMWRGYNAKQSYGLDRRSIISIQSMCRRFLAKKAVARHYALRKIQSTVRMWMAERLYFNLRRCICMIQGLIRRFLALIHVRTLKFRIAQSPPDDRDPSEVEEERYRKIATGDESSKPFFEIEPISMGIVSVDNRSDTPGTQSLPG